MVEGSAGGILGKSNRGSGVRLRITIHKKCCLFRGGEASRQIYRGSCLSNPSLLICNCDNSRQQVPQAAEVSRIAPRMQLVSRGTRVDLWNLVPERSTWNS